MSITALAPQVPPRWRLTTVGLALLLVLAALSLFATVAEEWRRPLTGTLTAAAAPASLAASWEPSAFATRAVTVLTTATCTLGLIAVLLALAQRSVHDLALAGAAGLWALLFQLGARNLAVADPAPALYVGAQTTLVSAVGLSLWYGLRLLKRTALQPHPLSLPRLLVLSSAAALLLALFDVVRHPFYWVLPMASVLVCGSALVRMVDMARRHGSALRPSPSAWLLAVSVACVIASGSRELWLSMAEPVSPEGLWGAWLLTRASVVLVLACALGLRLDQLARMLRHLGTSHGAWRQRLRDVQRRLVQARERLALVDRSEEHRARRDHLLRELHDDIGHRLLFALTALQQDPGSATTRPLQQLLEGSLIELRLAYDALEGVPRPLVEAMQDLRRQMTPLMQDAGVELRWAVEGPAETLVLSAAETLQLLRIVREALGSTLDRAAGEGPLHTVCRWTLDVADGETGRHLRLRISDEPLADRTSETPAVRLGAEWIQLQRQATSLGAQLALDPQAGPARRGWAIELVMPLTGR